VSTSSDSFLLAEIFCSGFRDGVAFWDRKLLIKALLALSVVLKLEIEWVAEKFEPKDALLAVDSRDVLTLA
jgi:hypothetical protein